MSAATLTQGPRADPAPLESPASDSEREYRRLMRKWWFAAAVGVPTMVLSYPWVLPITRDLFPRGSDALHHLWMAMGIASLAVLIYSGSQFFGGLVQSITHRTATMHTLIAIVEYSHAVPVPMAMSVCIVAVRCLTLWTNPLKNWLPE